MSRMGDRVRAATQDWAMSWLDEYRPAALELAQGRVLEVGFGTARNLRHYPQAVRSLAGVDPLPLVSEEVQQRMSAAPFPVEHHALRADGALPFESGAFDTIVSTWTLCSIPEVSRALAEMRRVLRPGGRFLFVEHGRSSRASTARWQDRLNPLWMRLTGGCNMNRSVEAMIREGGFDLAACQPFFGKGPQIIATMFRGVALRRE